MAICFLTYIESSNFLITMQKSVSLYNDGGHTVV
jgi:hypothetical protein